MEEAQRRMNEAINIYGISSPEALAASQALDPYKVEEQRQNMKKGGVSNGRS